MKTTHPYSVRPWAIVAMLVVSIATSLAAPFPARIYHSAVWTGDEMLIWGGAGNGSINYNTGARYHLASGTWTAMNPNAPEARWLHSAFWTGSEMLFWGGLNVTSLNTGGRYQPSTDSWVNITTNGAPTARYFNSAVWTGSEMLIWGGYATGYTNNGARFNPTSGNWIQMNGSGAPSPRMIHSTVWTGSEMLVWGGYDGNYTNTGGRYSPVTNVWAALPTAGAPTARGYHTAVWAGNQMIVWGGYDGDYANTGGRYNPATGWSPVTTVGAPIERVYHTAIWTGTEMIIWGGNSGGPNLNTGGRYNPVTDTWTPVTTNGAPSARGRHSAVWTGTEMIIWGGGGDVAVNNGGRYNPVSNTWTPLPAAPACLAGFPDDFECRGVLTGDNISLMDSNVTATKQVGEPNHGGNTGGKSMWWSWTAPYSGGVTLTTAGSSFDADVAVYTGTNLSLLTLVASDGRTNLAGSVTFRATAGVDYKIAVDGRDGTNGSIFLNLTLRPQPANDNFANRTTILAGNVAVGNNTGATMEASEADHADMVGGKSVWWTWTAPANTCVTITTADSDFDTTLAVYTNSSLASLVRVAANDDAMRAVASATTFRAVAGQTYQIAVDGVNRTSGNIVLRVIPFFEAPNDSFFNATLLSGSVAGVTISNLFGTVQAGEPDIWGSPDARTYWWVWVAPASGGVTLDTEGTDFYVNTGVYTGNSLGTLSQVSVSPDRQTFKAVAGTTYRIVVNIGGDFPDPTAAKLKLSLAFNASPPNDDFANRRFMGTAGVTTNGTIIGATTETNEPSHGLGRAFESLSRQTVWWIWNSPVHLPAHITTISTNFHTTVNIYSGSSLTNLTWIAGRSGTGATNRVVFHAIPSAVYVICVDGNAGGEGFYTLQAGYVAAAGAANDMFASRTSLSGATIFTNGYNIFASREAGEPNHGGYAGVASIWWTWNSPSAGRTFLTTIGSTFHTPLLGIYQGSSVNALTSVGFAFNPNTGCPYFSTGNFDSTGAQTFQIAVDTASGASTGGVDLGLRFIPRPVNDDFASRLPLTGSFVAVTGSVVAASQQIGETVSGFGNGLRTIWYSWTAPTDLGATSAGVNLRVIGKDFPGPEEVLVQVFQGTSLAGLTNVPAESELKGNTRQLSFTAQAGATYQIVVAAENTVGGGINDTYARRRINTPVIWEPGDFVMRLNCSTLSLRLRNVMPTEPPGPLMPNYAMKLPIGARADVINYGAMPSGPVRVRVLAMNKYSEIVGGTGEFLPVGNTSVPANNTLPIALNSGLPFGLNALAVLEEQFDGAWITRDSSLILNGFGGFYSLCSILIGGGVALLDPGVGNSCFCPPRLQRVQINGPAAVAEGGTGAYWGTAYFDNGNTPSFTNTVWATSNTNRFPIATNGILSPGSVTVDTGISITAFFNYLGVDRSTNRSVTILNLPPPTMNGYTRLQDGRFQLSLKGVANRSHVVEATTNLSSPIVWTSLGTNAANSAGNLFFIDNASTNLPRRFYRAREF